MGVQETASQGRPEVVLVRHGQTDWSRDGRHTGRSDIPLTEEGRRQATALGPRLAGRSFATVFVSPLGRARDTCRLAGLGQDAVVRDELAEFDYGEAEGLTTSQVREEHPGWTLWSSGAPGGESPFDVAVRLVPLIAELREISGDCAVFAHGHVLRVLAACWIEQPPATGACLALSVASVSTLGWEHRSPVIKTWNL